MKRILGPVVCFFMAAYANAQQDSLGKLTAEIVSEARRMYRSEMASWYGTDVFLEKYKERQNVGGYFSYEDKAGVKCIFFSKSERPEVIGTILFDSSYSTATAKTDLSVRDFNPVEKDMYALRAKALSVISTDTMFKVYDNTSLNLIPLIFGGQKKVYVLTGPKENGVVIFGNDYLLSFDQDNKLVEKRQLHKNIIPVKYAQNTNDEAALVSMHSHLPETGDFITVTDVCTLMLYGKFARWSQHMVVSKNYYSIWNCKTNDLLLMTKEAMDRIYKDQEARKKENE